MFGGQTVLGRHDLCKIQSCAFSRVACSGTRSFARANPRFRPGSVPCCRTFSGVAELQLARGTWTSLSFPEMMTVGSPVFAHQHAVHAVDLLILLVINVGADQLAHPDLAVIGSSGLICEGALLEIAVWLEVFVALSVTVLGFITAVVVAGYPSPVAAGFAGCRALCGEG